MADDDNFYRDVKLENIVITEHARCRLLERGISVDDVLTCLKTGSVIRHYADDIPLPSDLILGKVIDGHVIHIVVSHDDDYVYLNTAYYPDAEKWNDDFTEKR